MNENWSDDNMNKKTAEKVFEKYNRQDDVVRCPYGRAGTRKLLNTYAKAAVHLYGAISREDFVKIFNDQNTEQTTSQELYVLLLPLVLKDGWYGFYKDHLVHYWFFDDFEQVDRLLEHQAGKTRYVPDKNEFLEYERGDLTVNDHWWDVYRFMQEVFGYSMNTTNGFYEVKDYFTYENGIGELGPILDRYGLVFNREDQLHEFINMLMTAKNNTRTWLNNGWTPEEMQKQIRPQGNNTLEFEVVKKQKVGRNDPCPCGSGKKYKKCCAKSDNLKTAHLSREDGIEYYKIWYGLMHFVNERKHVIQATIKPDFPNITPEEEIYKVREALWENPELIDEYIAETELSKDRIEILSAWRNKHIKGMFFILEYQPDFAVAIGLNENGEDQLYGIKGITHSIAFAFDQKLPLQIETVLLPFKGKLVYDSFIATVPMGFGDGAKAAFQEMYRKALGKGILTTLE